MPSYFEAKFVFLCWLVFRNAAEKLYRKVHQLADWAHVLLQKIGICHEEHLEEWDEEDYLHELSQGLVYYSN